MGRYRQKFESPERLENVLGILQIYLYLASEYQENYVDDEQLQLISADVSKLSLENGKSDVNSKSFFKPLDKAVLETIWPKMRIGEDWPGWYGFCYNNYTAADSVYKFSARALSLEVKGKYLWNPRHDRLGLEQALSCFDWTGSEDQQQWTTIAIYESLDKNISHIGGRTIDIAEMHDDKLLRSEVLSIVALMLRKMTNRDMISQRYVPVYHITHAGMKARILVGYFDDERLKIQKSDIIEFGNGENMQGLKTIVRWTMCRAIGETEFKFPVKDPYHHGKMFEKKR